MQSVALRFVYSLPQGSAEFPSEIEEGFVAELFERGTLGVQTHAGAAAGRLTLDAYFPLPEAPGAGHELAEPGVRWRALGVELDRVEDVHRQDWLAGWRAASRPLEVGRRFLIDPREPSDQGTPAARIVAATAAPRFLLRLPARGAFGTGSHESTRLAVELLESMPLVGRTLLDVGTGTGVLAFAALALGAARATGCDIDPVAAFHAAENRVLNALYPTVWAGGLAALAPGRSFDVVVTNILPERIAGELPRLTAAVARGGRLVYSGTLAESSSEIEEKFAALGFREHSRRTAGEWAAMELVRS